MIKEREFTRYHGRAAALSVVVVRTSPGGVINVNVLVGCMDTFTVPSNAYAEWLGECIVSALPDHMTNEKESDVTMGARPVAMAMNHIVTILAVHLG